MIRINLARKVRPGGGLVIAGFDVSEFLSRLKGPETEETQEKKKFDLNAPIPRLVLAAAAVWLVEGTLTDYRTEALKVVDGEMAAVEREKAATLAKLARIKGFEPIKKQLEEDEKALRLKVEVVQKLLENRNAAAKVLMQVAQSIPEEIWLSSLKVEEKTVSITGSTPGYNQVSDFIKSLQNASQFGEVSLSGVQEVKTESREAGPRIQTFELKAARRSGG